MSDLSKRVLYWAPRALSIVFVAFMSLTATDVFDARLGFWQTLLALFLHLIPSLVLTAALVLAWRWEWIGTAVYGGAGLAYAVWVATTAHPVPVATQLVWVTFVAGPALVIALLFLANWLHHAELRTR